MVFEAHGMTFPCTDVLIIKLCQDKDHSMAPLSAL